MIHTARSTGKFIKLVRWLQRELGPLPVSHETVGVGLLERMWHFAITSHKRGDIGKSDDETIAYAIGWHGDASLIVAKLVECGWLVTHPQHRLVINDWEDHAPRHIKQNAKRIGGLISTKDISETLGGDQTSQVRRLVSTPNLTKPNLTKEEEEQSQQSPEEEILKKLPSPRVREKFQLWLRGIEACGKKLGDIAAEQTVLSLSAYPEPEQLAYVTWWIQQQYWTARFGTGAHRAHLPKDGPPRKAAKPEAAPTKPQRRVYPPRKKCVRKKPGAVA